MMSRGAKKGPLQHYLTSRRAGLTFRATPDLRAYLLTRLISTADTHAFTFQSHALLSVAATHRAEAPNDTSTSTASLEAAVSSNRWLLGLVGAGGMSHV
jgi:hypothetical protein